MESPEVPDKILRTVNYVWVRQASVHTKTPWICGIPQGDLQVVVVVVNSAPEGHRAVQSFNAGAYDTNPTTISWYRRRESRALPDARIGPAMCSGGIVLTDFTSCWPIFHFLSTCSLIQSVSGKYIFILWYLHTISFTSEISHLSRAHHRDRQLQQYNEWLPTCGCTAGTLLGLVIILNCEIFYRCPRFAKL